MTRMMRVRLAGPLPPCGRAGLVVVKMRVAQAESLCGAVPDWGKLPDPRHLAGRMGRIEPRSVCAKRPLGEGSATAGQPSDRAESPRRLPSGIDLTSGMSGVGGLIPVVGITGTFGFGNVLGRIDPGIFPAGTKCWDDSDETPCKPTLYGSNGPSGRHNPVIPGSTLGTGPHAVRRPSIGESRSVTAGSSPGNAEHRRRWPPGTCGEARDGQCRGTSSSRRDRFVRHRGRIRGHLHGGRRDQGRGKGGPRPEPGSSARSNALRRRDQHHDAGYSLADHRPRPPQLRTGPDGGEAAVSELITAIVLIAVIFVFGLTAGYLVAVLCGRKGRP